MTSKIAVVILAAGRSSRMAPRNKLLERLAGKPTVARVADVALASGAHPAIVVTGFEASRIAAALGDRDLTFAHNPTFAEGLSSSLKVGLSALPPDSDGALILLGDMPALEVAVLRALMSAFANRESICVPVQDGRRGNPVLWGAAYFSEMMSLGGDAGAKQLLVRHAECVIEVPVESDGIFIDVDTPSDLARLIAGAKARQSR